MKINSLGPQNLNIVQIHNKEPHKTLKAEHLPRFSTHLMLLGKSISNLILKKLFIPLTPIYQSGFDVPVKNVKTNPGFYLCYVPKLYLIIKI